MVKWLSRFSSSNGSTPISGFMTDTPDRLSSYEIRSDFRYRTHFLEGYNSIPRLMTLLAYIYGNLMQIAQFWIQKIWVWDFLQSLLTKNKSDWKYNLFMSSNIHEKFSQNVMFELLKKTIQNSILVVWLKKGIWTWYIYYNQTIIIFHSNPNTKG